MVPNTGSERGMIYGYARVSTPEQPLLNQIERLKEYGCIHIYSEKISGASIERPELQALLDKVSCGDTIVVTKIDRLARSLSHLLRVVESLAASGVELVSLSEPWCDTTTNIGKLMLTIIGGLAEFERSLIMERAEAGRMKAKARGVKFGRKLILNDEQCRKVLELRKSYSVREIADIYRVSKSTIKRAIRRSQPIKK